MIYKVLWHEDALVDLNKIGSPNAGAILDKVENYLAKDPTHLGKPLKGPFKGFFRFRFGKYRIIYLINPGEIVILILRVAKRDKIYKD